MRLLKLNSVEYKTSTNMNFYRDAWRYIKIVICVAICTISIINFFAPALASYNNVQVPLHGADFLYFYSGGLLWDRGENEYNSTLFFDSMMEVAGEKAYWLQPYYYYLPPATALFGVFARQSYADAFNLYWFINIFLTFATIGLLGVILSWYRRIGLLEITILCIFLNSPFGRSTILLGQLGSPLFLLILAAFILSRYERHVHGAILTSLLVIKFSFMPLYMGYYLLRRHYRAFIAGMLVFAALNIVPVVVTQKPIFQTFRSWAGMMRVSQMPGYSNSPSPFEIHSLQHVDLKPLINRVFNTDSTFTGILSWVLIGAFTAYSAYLITRSRETLKSRLLDFSLVSLLSILFIYHRYYDVFLTFPALLYLYIHTFEQKAPSARRNWAIFTGLMFAVLLIPQDIAVDMARQDPSLLESSYLWRLVAPYLGWFNLILFGVMLWLKRQQVMQERQAVSSPAEPSALPAAQIS